jgi:ABC-type transport system substrate-binding protein
MVLPLAIILCLGVMPFLANPVQAANPPAFFTISVLAPNSNPARNQWATLMVEQLPKIGIGVDVFDHTGWAQISPRTWGYPGPYPVPSYAEGGFDLFFVGWSWGLDVDLKGLFDTPSMPPFGDNFYQYSVPEMDWAIGNYSQSFVLADRINAAHDIQALLYEDVPAATIVYPLDVFPHTTALVPTSWTPLLWDTSYADMAYWDIGDTEFHYGCPADFEDFHTMKTESVYDAQWTQQIYGGMVERTPLAPYNNAFGPYLATTFSSGNGINYTVTLDSGAKFADGVKCNASDVKYSYDLLINPLFGQPDYGFFSEYINSNTIKIVSEFEVAVDFIQPYVFQDNNLGVDILPKHIWEVIAPADHESQAVTWAADNTDDSKITGIGPYYLYDYDGTNGVIHLKANTYWDDWGGHATQEILDLYFEFWSNKEGALSALAAGDLDMVDSQFSPQLAEIPPTVDYTVVTAPGSQELDFNCLHPMIGTGELTPLGTEDAGKYIRQAISHLIPRETIVSEILNGLGDPGITPYPKGAVGFDETLLPYEYSIDLAKQKMEDAGFEYPTTVSSGIGLYVVIGILALAGASQVFFLKRRK